MTAVNTTVAPPAPTRRRAVPVNPLAPKQTTRATDQLPIRSTSDAVARLAQSPTGAWLIDQLRATGKPPKIEIVPDSQMGPDENGHYNRETNTVALKRSVVEDYPNSAIVTLGHELFHGLDLLKGVRTSIVRDHDQTTAKLIIESRAYAFASRVQHELGYEPTGPVAAAAYDGTSPDQAYRNAWEALKVRDDIASDAPVVYAPNRTTPY